MKVSELLDAPRGILAETGIEEFPYRRIGAGFLASFRDLGLFVTAKHVVAGEDPNDILVFPTTDHDSLALLKQADIEGDDSFTEIALFPFKAETLDIDFPAWRSLAVPITQGAVSRGRNSLQASSDLVVAGIPEENRIPDYDNKRLPFTTVVLPAIYEAVDGRNWIHRGRLLQTGGLASFQGLSGSPVLTLTPPTWGLAGCLIEASIESMLFHFIDSAVLWNAAKRVWLDLNKGAV